MTRERIVANRAKCRKCNTIIESDTRHHLCFCACGSIFVDGGKSYLRRGGNISDIEEMSVVEEIPETTKPTNN